MIMPTPKKLEIIVRGVAIHDGRLLLCRNIEHGHAYLPGGHVEAGEPAGEALSREFLEETGLQVRAGEFLTANENLFVQGRKPRHELNLVFHVEHRAGPWPGAILSREPEIAFEWAEMAALPESGFVPPAMLAWLLAGGPAASDCARWVSHIDFPH